ncbi:MAG TPA: TonB-dependent receptor [Granulicella sp.]|nr:TonB-dependent receptor [Granulicella sp.]
MPLAFVCLTAAPVLAQTSTQGSISGTVFDASGALVPQASVTIHNDATDAEVHLKSDSSGGFKAPLLEPGTYTVTVDATGLSEYRVTAVTVLVGQTTSVNPHMQTGEVSTTVSVTAGTPVMNLESPEFSSNMNAKALANIPINNRRWSALAELTPGVTSDSSGYGLVSVRGISTILNNVEIDGADDNQAFFSEERGRTREAYSTSGSAVREFQVNTGVYPAEFGRAAGGVINSVTKSGTNKFHGEAYFYDRESNWAAYNAQTTVTTLNPATNTNVTTPVKPEDLRKIYGFTISGPLVKDKLFFIYTFDQHAHIFPMLGAPANPAEFYSQPDAALPGGTSCNMTTGVFTGTAANALDAQVCTLAARLSVSGQTAYGHSVSYANAANLYNTGVNALSSDIGLIPRTGYQEINTPKLDWQINSRNQVSFLYHRLRWDSPGGVQTSPTGHYSLDSTGTDFVKLDYGVTKLTSLISANVSNELLFQYGRELNDEGKQPQTAYDTQNLVENGNDPYVALATGTEGAYVGSPYYSYRPAYPDERKWQIGDNLFYQHGKHNLKFGVDMVHNYDLSNQSQYYEGDFTYSSYLTNYFADLYSKGYASGTCSASLAVSSTSASTVGNYPCYNSFLQEYGPTTFDLATLDQGYYAQDDWKVTPRLTVQMGLRYDYEGLPNVYRALTAATTGYTPFNGINNHPSDKNNFGPRIGFSYDVFGTGKTVLHGGYGLYYGRITNGNLETALTTTGSPLAQRSTTVNATTGNEPIFPYILNPNQLSSTAKSSAYFLAPNLQNPQVHEFDLILQQEVGRGTVVSASYLGSLGRELPNFVDVNLNPNTKNETITVADSTGKSPLPNGTALTVPVFTSYGNTALLGPSATNFQAITEYMSNINSNYNALALEVQNRSLKNIQFDVNYTWAHALDYYQNSSTAGDTNNWYNPYGSARSNYGNSTWDVKDRLVAYALYSFPNLETGNWVKYLTNGWKLNDTFQIQTGMPYSASTSGGVTGAISSTGLNGNGGVTFVPQLGINSFFQPRIMIDDARLEKDFVLKDRYNLQLFAQAFNVANHQNVSAVYTEAYALSGTTATYQKTFGQTEYTNDSGFNYAPRQVEISARFMF